MLIISKFHDFYDHVSQAGVDKNVVLQRKQEHVDIPNGVNYRNMELARLATKRTPRGWFEEGRVFELQWLFFCGKAYPGIISYHQVEKGRIRSDYQQHTKEELENIISLDSKYYKRDWRSDLTPQQQLKEALSGNNIVSSDVFHNLDVPYFAFDVVKDDSGRYTREVSKVLLYPNLKQYTSFLKMDAYTVYQEIEMYCSGVLGVGEPEMIEISDILKRDSKGFDKYSFKHRK